MEVSQIGGGISHLKASKLNLPPSMAHSEKVSQKGHGTKSGTKSSWKVQFYLDLQNPKIFWSMWFVLLYCDDQLKSGRAHMIQTKSGRAWSHTALPVASGCLMDEDEDDDDDDDDDWSVSREFKSMISYACPKHVAKSSAAGFAIAWAVDIPL